MYIYISVNLMYNPSPAAMPPLRRTLRPRHEKCSGAWTILSDFKVCRDGIAIWLSVSTRHMSF